MSRVSYEASTRNEGKRNLIQLDEKEAHLWYIRPEKVRDEKIMRSCYEVLSKAEKKQQEKYVFEKDRKLYLVAHGFVRRWLSRYSDVLPEQWVFRKNEYGKPFLDMPSMKRRLEFNMSHTSGLVTCIVTIDHNIGVDAENITWEESRMEIAERYFSKDEVDSLKSSTKEDRIVRFYQYWTLKEAYVKARGMGVSIPFDKSTFRINENKTIDVSFSENLCDKPKRWSFYLYRLTEQHMCAVAIESTGTPVKVTAIEEETI